MNATDRRHQDYWDNFYRSRRAALSDTPSAFARWSLPLFDPAVVLLDVGCGNARDALWFAAHGLRVRAYDYSAAAIEVACTSASAAELDVSFDLLNLYDDDQVAATARSIGTSGAQHAVYARFLLHALEPIGQDNLLAFAAEILASGGLLCCEFRTNADRSRRHVFGEHFRSYPDPDAVVGALVATGARISERHEGYGMAVYRDEDPHVCRLVAQWTP